MTDHLTEGLAHTATYTVTRAMSPPHLEDVLSTPALVGLIEDTCLDALAPYLAAGSTTVGTEVCLRHVGAARAGETVRVVVRLVKITQRRLLSFEVEAQGPSGVVGSGSHQRLVVDRSRLHQQKTAP